MQTAFISNNEQRETWMKKKVGYGSDMFSLGSTFSGINELEAVSDLISFILLAKDNYGEASLPGNPFFTLNGIDRNE